MTFIEVPLLDIFEPKNGSSKYTKQYCNEHSGTYKLYSGNTEGHFSCIDSFDYDGNFLTWAKDGLAGYIMIHMDEKFSITGHRSILIEKNPESGIYLPYIKYILEPIFRELIKGRLGEKGKNEYTTLNPDMIKKADIKILIPIKQDGSYDLEEQQRLAGEYQLIDEKKAQLQDLVEEIINKVPDIRFENMVEVPLGDLFEPSRGKIISKAYMNEHKGEYPVYSTQEGVFGYIDEYMEDGNYLLWNTDGLAGYIKVVDGKFSYTNIVGILKPLQPEIMAGISLKYIKYYLEPIFRANRKGRLGEKGKNEYTKFNSTMLMDLNIKIPIPVNEDGTYNIEKQDDIAQKYERIDALKIELQNKIEKIVSTTVIIE